MAFNLKGPTSFQKNITHIAFLANPFCWRLKTDDFYSLTKPLPDSEVNQWIY